MKKLLTFLFCLLLTISAVSAATADSVQKSIVVDGDVSDWSGVSSYSVEEGSSVSSSDLSGSFRSVWDDEYIYFLAEVTDDEVDSTSGDYIFEHDSIEMMLDGGNEKSTSYDSNDHKFMARADGQDVMIWTGSWSGVSSDDMLASAQQTADGYILEVGIRWSLVGGQSPADGIVYGFDFAINDRDGETYDGQLIWRYAVNHSRDTSGWHSLSLSGSSTSSQYSFSPSSLDFTSSNSQTLEIDVYDTVIYDTGYYSLDGGIDWIEFSLSGSKAGNWVLSSASSSISLNLVDVNSSGDERVAFYACSWNGGWDCHGNDWQIESFNVMFPETSDGPVCGNGVVETGEECDGPNLDGETCQTQGLDNGTLSCDSCSFDTSGCFDNPVGDSGGVDSRAGDEAALEALYAAANGDGWTDNKGWSSSGMSLSDNIYGVTVENINGELRVTEIDLRDNGLTGNIEVQELGNLKQMRLFAVYHNDLYSQIPDELMSLENMEYLYLVVAGGHPADKFPHEEAADGGGDVHPRKHKTSEENVFYGPVPAPKNPDRMSLKWLVLNWADSAEGVADGISELPDEIFDIDTFFGLQFFNNNNVAKRPFPQGICNMSNLNNLAIGVEHAGRKTGPLTGTIPGCVSNLTNLQFIRLGENPDLVLDFDVLSLSKFTKMRAFQISSVKVRGSFPGEVLNGTMDDHLVRFSVAWPVGDTGMTGTLPTGAERMQVFTVTDNQLQGQIPARFWDNVQIINTNFGYNNFTSIGTDDLTHLGSKYWKIRNLRWYNNEISGPWPKLAWGTDRLEKFTRFQVANNRYVFRDMLYVPDNAPNGETIFELMKAEADVSFSYAPQKPFGTPATVNVNVGDDVVLDNFVGNVSHADNVYQWEKDGSALSGATSRTLTLNKVGSGDSGTYKLIVDNPNVPGLTLESEPIEVTIQ